MKTTSPSRLQNPVVTRVVHGRRVEIGAGFSALTFGHEHFDGLMDPLVMVDHFTMSEPTFGPHAHAGMSAVSVLFEDSKGLFRNRDSLGHDLDLEPGDLYWLKAARGAVHDEGPRPRGRTHALQVFVNIPAAARRNEPEALLVRADDIPELRGEGYRVRVVLGQSRGVSGASSPALPMTLLDAHLDEGGAFTHELPSKSHAWLHPIHGRVQVTVGDVSLALGPDEALAVSGNGCAGELELSSTAGAQIVLLQGRPIGESFVQRGPFVMTTLEEIDAVAAAYAAGELGSID